MCLVDAESWYDESLEYVREREIFTGVDPEHFRPNDPTTRADFVVVLSRCVTNFKKAPLASKYIDVPCEKNFYDAVQWAYFNGIAKGVALYYCKPYRNITREEAVKMIYGVVKASGQNTDTTPSDKQFADRGAVSPWAKEAMDWAIDTGVINGDEQNRIHPQSDLTRAQFAVMVYNARDILLDIELW